ncbi:MAG TPA: hypothetical protein VN372_15740 [Methanospirillum sp.]|nr:hypothetical protein [Methanospirillum sp.]
MRLECWRYPPTPIFGGGDPDGKPRFMHMRPRVEAPWKCGEWLEKKIGYW